MGDELNRKNSYWPKDKNDFSDYVTRHLDENIRTHGVGVNREVQIRRGTGGGTGEFTDIHVDAIVPAANPGTYARVYAIVEAKGNWDQELFTAMESQLRERYCELGVLLVFAWGYRTERRSPVIIGLSKVR